MALTNTRGAWVNRSGTAIPVYSTLVDSSVYAGGLTAGGTQTGSIAPNDFYMLIENSSPYITWHEIRFRDYSGQRATGYIEKSQGYTLPDYGWVTHQEPFHRYNSDGSTLVESVPKDINGENYHIFEIAGSTLQMYNSSGAFTATLPIGAKLATPTSEIGMLYPHLMYFRYRTLNGVWVDMHSTGDPWGFVDVRIDSGVSPSTRRIR